MQRIKGGITTCHKILLSKIFRLLLLVLLSAIFFTTNNEYPDIRKYAHTDLHTSPASINTLSMVNDLTSAVLAVVSSLLIDRFIGVQFATVLFTVTSLLGQFLLSFGALYHSFVLLVIGEIISGGTTTAVMITQHVYVLRWFDEREYPLVFSVLFAAHRLAFAFDGDLLTAFTKGALKMFGSKAALGIGLIMSTLPSLLAIFASRGLTALDDLSEKYGPSKKFRSALAGYDVSRIEVWKLTIMMSLASAFYCTPLLAFISNGEIIFSTKFNLLPAHASAEVHIILYSAAIAGPIIGLLAFVTGGVIYWLIGATYFVYIPYLWLASSDNYVPWLTSIVLGLPFAFIPALYSALIGTVAQPHWSATPFGIFFGVARLFLSIMRFSSDGFIKAYGIFLFLGGALIMNNVCTVLVQIFYVMTERYSLEINKIAKFIG